MSYGGARTSNPRCRRLNLSLAAGMGRFVGVTSRSWVNSSQKTVQLNFLPTLVRVADSELSESVPEARDRRAADHGRCEPPGTARRPAARTAGTTISVLVVWQSTHRTIPTCGWYRGLRW